MSLSDSARAALRELAADNDALARACDGIFFSDDEAVCRGEVEDVQRFLSGPAARLLVRVDAGDANAAADLADAVRGIRATVVGEAARVGMELSTGALLGRFVDEVVLQTGRDVAAGSKSLAPFLFVGAGIVGGLWLWSLSRR